MLLDMKSTIAAMRLTYATPKRSIMPITVPMRTLA